MAREELLSSIYEILSEEENWTLQISELIYRLSEFEDLSFPRGRQFVNFVHTFPHNFEVFFGHIKAKTTTGFCSKHCIKAGSCDGQSGCTGLHMCKFYLRHGKCKYRDGCEFGHDLKTRHNKLILEEHFLDSVPVSRLKDLFRYSENESEITSLAVCNFYNDTQGCKKGHSCPYLHICKHYIYGSCKFTDARCQKSHNLKTSQPLGVLGKHGINTQKHGAAILRDLREMLQCDGRKVRRDLSCDSRLKRGNVPFVDTKKSEQVLKPIAICKFYNTPGGCGNYVAGPRGLKQTCPFLHICKHYISNTCKFPANCRQSHDLKNPQTVIILEKYGIESQRDEGAILKDLRKMLQVGAAKIKRGLSYESLLSKDIVPFSFNPNLLDPRGPSNQTGSVSKGAYPKTTGTQSVDQSNKLLKDFASPSDLATDICLHNLRGRCRFGILCCKQHKASTYHWQYRSAIDSIEWNDFSAEQNTEIEEVFCKPDNVSHRFEMRPGTFFKIDFLAMKIVDNSSNQMEIRRLSTLSSVGASYDPLTTIWKWYWLFDDKKWIEYGQEDFSGNRSDIDHTIVEQKYQENPQMEMTFSTKQHNYVLNFSDMFQKNVKIGTKREVRRRPVFLSKDSVEKKKKEKISASVIASKSALDVTTPSVWKTEANFSTLDQLLDHFQILPVDKTTKEFSDIQILFQKSLLQETKIKAIKRIQNGDLWISFSREREKMKRKLKLTEEEFLSKGKEKQLFHGTDHVHVKDICRQGFDFRLGGKRTGTRYGKGSYFATDARYSQMYANNNELFIARVLVGEYCKGDPTYVRPPVRGGHELYDACVDSDVNPEIFVIFDMYRSYPEYIIEY